MQKNHLRPQTLVIYNFTFNASCQVKIALQVKLVYLSCFCLKLCKGHITQVLGYKLSGGAETRCKQTKQGIVVV